MLRCGDVDIPLEVFESLRQDRLVVFAGAGASCAEPAGLPLFKGLTRQIAQDDALEVPDDRFDVHLGKMVADGVPVHDHAEALLESAAPEPNDVHLELVRLFQIPERIRIVTTNYDLLFEEAAAEVYAEENRPRVYRAPALPLGSDFHGVVHLHGALRDRSDRMVLTDGDFGRAYLTEGWARRFVLQMFRTFDVLFVGYSHNDLVMTYIARGLPAADGCRRFAFVGRDESDNDEQDEWWEFLGITPLHYMTAGADHSALPNALRSLRMREERGAYDLKRELERVVAGVDFGEADKEEDATNDEADIPDGEPRRLADADRRLVESVITSPSDVEFFTSVAEDPGWIDWLVDNGFLDSMISNAPLDKAQQSLARWVTEVALENPSEFMLTLKRRRILLPDALAVQICHRLGLRNATSDQLRVWVPLIVQAMRPPNAWPGIYELLRRALEKGEAEVSLLLLRALLRAYTKPSSTLTFGETVDDMQRAGSLDAKLLGDPYQLRRVLPDAAELVELTGGDLWHLLIERLLDLARLRKLVGAGALSGWRSAIEDHEQDLGHSTLDLMIDLARDILEFDLGAPEGRRRTDVLLESRLPLLQRLGLHGLRLDETRTPDEKLDVILDRGWLFDGLRRHEVFLVLRDAFPNAQEELQQKILRQIRDHSDGLDERHVQYSKFNLLYWLHQAEEDHQEVETRLTEIQSKYGFEPRPYPDLTSYTTSGGFDVESPRWSIEELVRKGADAVADALTADLGDDQRRVDLRTLARAVAEEPALGLTLAEDHGRDIQCDVWDSIFTGLDEAPTDRQLVERLIDILEAWPPCEDGLRAAARLLRSLGQREVVQDADLDRLNAVADNIWDAIDGDDHLFEHWYQTAINRPGGVLGEFWLQQLDPRADEEAGDQLNSRRAGVLARLSRVLSGDETKNRHVASIIGRALDYLLHVDVDWSLEHVVARLSFDQQPVIAQAMWDGVAFISRLSPMFPTYCRDAYVQMFEHLARMPQQIRTGLISQVAVFAVHLGEDPIREWVRPFMSSTDPDARARLVRRIGGIVEGLDPDEQEAVWEHWLRQFLEDRQANRPSAPSPAEVAAFFNLTLACRALFPMLAQRLRGWREPVSVNEVRLLELYRDDNDLLHEFPALAAMFLDELARLADPDDPATCSRLVPALDQVVDAGVREDGIRSACDRLRSKNCKGLVGIYGKLNPSSGDDE